MPETTESPILVHRIDKSDRIVFVNEEWLSFAAENGAPRLTRDRVIGTSIWDYIKGWETRHLYLLMFQFLRKEVGRKVDVSMRCDTPNARRFMQLEAEAAPDGNIEFRSWVTKLEYRDQAVPTQRSVPKHPNLLFICSICQRVLTEQHEWLEMDEAIKQYDLFDADMIQQVSHGICSSCQKHIMQKLMRPLKKIMHRQF